jgi:hypothetical protein
MPTDLLNTSISTAVLSLYWPRSSSKSCSVRHNTLRHGAVDIVFPSFVILGYQQIPFRLPIAFFACVLRALIPLYSAPSWFTITPKYLPPYSIVLFHCHSIYQIFLVWSNTQVFTFLNVYHHPVLLILSLDLPGRVFQIFFIFGKQRLIIGKLYIWDFRFSRRRVWKLELSRMQRRVVS